MAKYGLGSSAAVTVATVKALCLYDLPVDKDKLFKLAAIAHFASRQRFIGGCGSFGIWRLDRVHSFDRQWLAEQRQYLDLPTLLDLPWPDLKSNH